MKAEIIAIGDELSSGQRLDTNSQWISRRLGELGIQTVRHTTVGDDLEANVDALRFAAERVDIVVCTGGLGPTLDDLTRQALADAFDCPLELDADSLAKIEAMFASRNRAMPERNRLQAMFPSGSQVVPNPHGSAPGIDLLVGRAGDHRCRFFALPGVPAEMRQMWSETIVSRLEEHLGIDLGPLRYHSVKVFGIGESDVEVKLPDLIARTRQPTVGITVSRATITLRIAGRAHSDQEFAALIEPSIGEIRSALGDLIFGEGDDEIQHAVTRLLKESGKSLAIVEIGSASWIASWMLAASDDSSPVLGGALTLPSRSYAREWVRVQRGTELQEGESLALPLALLVQKLFAVDLVLVVSEYPSQNAMENAKEPFEPEFLLVADGKVQEVCRRMGGHPDVLGPRIAKTGLDIVRRTLAGLPITPSR